MVGGLGTRAGLLYASNTAGAIAGALAAGLYLIPQIGLSRSFLLAAIVNGVVGTSALILSRVRERADVPADPGTIDPAAPDDATLLPLSVRYVVLAVFAVSGFASLALEIVWFRVLAILLGPSSYAFTLMLATVLAGIALGSYLITPFMRRRADWLQILAALQIAAAFVALRSFNGLRRPVHAPGLARAAAAVVHRLHGARPRCRASSRSCRPPSSSGWPFRWDCACGPAPAATNAERPDASACSIRSTSAAAFSDRSPAGFLLLPRLTSHGSLIALAALFLALRSRGAGRAGAAPAAW